MNVDIGGRVRSMDDQDLGVVDRLILDPVKNEVTSVVLRKGAWLPRDVEVPIGDLRADQNGEYTITLSAAEIHGLPEFHEAHYMAPPHEFAMASGFTPGSVYWPAGIMMGAPRNVPGMGQEPDPTMGMAVEKEVDSALSREAWDPAVIRKGSTVTGRDGKNIGKVEDVSFDSKTGELTGLVVRSGLLMHTDRPLDPSLIASVDEGTVYLKVDSDQVPAS